MSFHSSTLSFHSSFIFSIIFITSFNFQMNKRMPRVLQLYK
ncbi:hypothetical protein LOK49_LG15G00718 [Camellia lanceoleosa]|uniref:Uncharacterized protein n=1 Tax=Camellia lanceoleosa TaxID=1840588 RepID=A0ACC0F4Y1_9ERIC|nr:hypothetical protein LOK49_LG15G00718 [Camellia lanceoleosa]